MGLFCDIGEVASIQVLQQRIVDIFSGKIYQLCENTDYEGHNYIQKLQQLKNAQYGVDYGGDTLYRNGKKHGRLLYHVRATLIANCRMVNTQILDTFDIHTIESIKENLNGFLNEAKKVRVGDIIKLNTNKNPIIFNALCNFYLYNCIYRTIEGVHFEDMRKGSERNTDIIGTQSTTYNMWLYKPLENYNIEEIDNLLDVFSVNNDYTHPNPKNMIVLPYKF